MGVSSERAVIRSRLSSSWGTITAIAWDGFNGPAYTRVDGTEFIRPRIEDGESEWVSVAWPTMLERKVATLIIEVYCPAGSGDSRGNQLCDVLIRLFSPYTSGSVRFDKRGFVVDAGTDGTFHRWHVMLPYYYESQADTVSVTAPLLTESGAFLLTEDGSVIFSEG